MSDKFEFQTSLNLREGSGTLTASKKDETDESSASSKSITKLIEAIHETTTSNFTTYTANELRKATNTWLKPYNKPVLTHHQSRSGEPIGRVIDSEFENFTSANKPGHILLVNITDPDAIEKIEDGRYSTVSVGGHADKAICSICGTDWVSEGWCSHSPGGEYDDEIAHLVLRELDFKEVSFVNVPADEYARIIEGKIKNEGKNENKESFSQFVSNDFLEAVNEPSKTGGGGGGKTSNAANNKGGYSMEAEEKVDLLEEKVETKDDRIQALEGKVSNLEDKVETYKEEKENLEEKIVTLGDEKELLEDEMDDLTEENQELKDKVHKQLAEDVVDKKIELGKIAKEDKEEMLEDHIERTEDSLNDSLKDLEYEIENMEEDDEGETSEMGEEVDNEGIPLDEEQVETDGDDDNIDEEIASRFS